LIAETVETNILLHLSYLFCDNIIIEYTKLYQKSKLVFSVIDNGEIKVTTSFSDLNAKKWNIETIFVHPLYLD